MDSNDLGSSFNLAIAWLCGLMMILNPSVLGFLIGVLVCLDRQSLGSGTSC